MRTADDYVLDFRHDDGSAMMANFHGVPWHAALLRQWADSLGYRISQKPK